MVDNTRTANHNLARFAQTIQGHREELLQTWRLEVRRLPNEQPLDIPTLNDQFPDLLAELRCAMLTHTTI
jgi:hypothetical protein